jgi:hypothetical protein
MFDAICIARKSLGVKEEDVLGLSNALFYTEYSSG